MFGCAVTAVNAAVKCHRREPWWREEDCRSCVCCIPFRRAHAGAFPATGCLRRWLSGLTRVARDRRQCCDALVDLLRRKFDIHLDLFEMYALRNIFRVPSDLQVRKGFGANAATWADRGNSVAVETPGRVYGRCVSTHNSVHRGGRGAG